MHIFDSTSIFKSFLIFGLDWTADCPVHCPKKQPFVGSNDIPELTDFSLRKLRDKFSMTVQNMKVLKEIILSINEE
jgi:hypothetical protein